MKTNPQTTGSASTAVAAGASPLSALSQCEPWNLVAAAYQRDMVSLFSHFADVALDLANVGRESTVLDVATGPGTLAFRAAARVRQVVAIDFASDMIGQLRERASRERVENIESHVMDGQQLTFTDRTFDAAFSMFGLIFFPDRGRGMSELMRVVKRGGRVVLASWAAIEKCPIIETGMTAAGAALGDKSAPAQRPAFEDPEDLGNAMRSAGFESVVVRQASYEHTYVSADAYWDMFARSFAPLVLLHRTMGEDRWGAFERDARARVNVAVGKGPIALSGLANLAAGSVPAEH